MVGLGLGLGLCILVVRASVIDPPPAISTRGRGG